MTDDLKLILEKLKSDYLKNLPGRIEQIESLWGSREMKLIKTEFHKLKGTGKTYGLPEISDLGLVAEELSVTDTTEKAIPLAIDLLKEILKARQAGNEFDLAKAQAYKTLTALRKAA
jgi:hypothetical protein